MNDNQIKHLEFIQNTITRMNHNSFLIKGWMITIATSLLIIYTETNDNFYYLISLLPIILFWCLDTYYLQQERKFRGLYNDIINGSNIQPFSMSTQQYKGGKYTFWKVFFSKSIICTYLSTLIIVSIFMTH